MYAQVARATQWRIPIVSRPQRSSRLCRPRERVARLAGARTCRAFTIIELVMLIAIAAVLIGLLIRGVQLAREAARFAEMQARLTGAYCDALHAYFKQHGMYPRTLTDPALDGYMPEIPGTSNRYTPAQIADTLGFKVDYSVTPGTRGNESEWDFSLCAVQRSTTRTGCMNRKCQFKTSANTPIGLPAGAIARV